MSMSFERLVLWTGTLAGLTPLGRSDAPCPRIGSRAGCGKSPRASDDADASVRSKSDDCRCTVPESYCSISSTVAYRSRSHRPNLYCSSSPMAVKVEPPSSRALACFVKGVLAPCRTTTCTWTSVPRPTAGVTTVDLARGNATRRKKTTRETTTWWDQHRGLHV